MVVASGGWVQNVNYPGEQTNSNLNNQNQNSDTTTENNNNNNNNNNMNNNKTGLAKGILICRDNSHPFHERTLSLQHPIKIGRSVARARATCNNATFDCKVLSRNHALLWYSGGKFYLQDTRSSNGTFVNNLRLSASGLESTPMEVCSGDIVQFGVDVIESTMKVTHGCIVATLKLFLPDGKEAKASLITSVASPASHVSLEDLYKLHQVLLEASRRENILHSKLKYLTQLVDNTRNAANQSWQALISEDCLLSWVEKLESQLNIYSKNFTDNQLRNELIKFHDEKAQYQNAAKESLQKVLQEEMEIKRRLMELKTRFVETKEECKSFQSIAKYNENELQELSIKYTGLQKKLDETTNNLRKNDEILEETVMKMEEEKSEMLKKFQEQSRHEMSKMMTKLQASYVELSNVFKHIVALKNAMKKLHNVRCKLITSDDEHDNDAKDFTINRENPLEQIETIVNKLFDHYTDNQINVDIKLYLNEKDQDNPNHFDALFQYSSKEQLLLIDNSLIDKNTTNFNEFILPPTSSPKRNLLNGDRGLVEDNIPETNEQKQEEQVEVEDNEKSSTEVVHFASQVEEISNTETDSDSEKSSVEFSPQQNLSSLEEFYEEGDENNSREERMEKDYIKTLKASFEVVQKNVSSKEYVLQSLISSFDSLKDTDDAEGQIIVKRELEDLREWLINESNETIIDKLKELYYRAKNESERVQEVNEELVILKEKFNASMDEKTELSNKYTNLKTQCGDLLNVSYTVPIQYFVPVVLGFVWLLLDKMF